MKYFILVSLFSYNAFAVGISSVNDFTKIQESIVNDKSITQLVKDFKKNKILVHQEYDNGKILSKTGRSSFASLLVEYRLNGIKPIGDMNENLDLLNFFINNGVDVNAIQTDNDHFLNNSLGDVASRSCSIDAIKLLEKNGEDFTKENFLWVDAYNASTLFPLGSKEYKTCINVAEYMITKSNDSNLDVLHRLFYPIDDYFSKGEELDQYFSPFLKKFLNDNLNITLSKRPNSPRPTSDAFLYFKKEIFLIVFDGDDIAKEWSALSNDEKEWACYLSSFDEFVEVLNNWGFTDNQIEYAGAQYGYPLGFS